MAGKIAQLVGKAESEAESLVAKLEDMSGFPSEDVRMLAGMMQRSRAKLTQLGLDPDDTTAEELYYSLRAKFDRDSLLIDRALGVKEGATSAECQLKACKLVNYAVSSAEVWTLKPAATKEVLRANVPKKVMKKLGYRSIDSMLKREDFTATFLAAKAIESPTWQKKLASQLHRKTTASYELRSLRATSLPEKLASYEIKDKVVASGELGVAAVWPTHNQVSVLSLSLALLNALDGICEQKLHHRLHSVHPALNWWSDTEHLFYAPKGELVSLNFLDIADDHTAEKPFEHRSHDNAHLAFWNQLADRYKQYLTELPDEVVGAEKKIESAFELRPELVEELVEA